MAETETTANSASEASAAPPLKLPVRRMDGSATGEEVELDPRLFSLSRNDHVLWLAVKAELANRRQGTHATKNRALVHGGGRKPWRQKGRGTARAGTIRSPLWVGGGTMFGPQPHRHALKVPAKVRRLARRVAFSVKAQSGSIELVDDITLKQPRTRVIADMLKAFAAAGKSVLILVNGNHPMIVMSCRNIPRVEIRDCSNASTYDILSARRVIISRPALDSLVGGLVGEK